MPPPEPGMPMAGECYLSFNGETSSDPLPVDALVRLASGFVNGSDATDAAQLVKVRLQALSTVSRVGVSASVRYAEGTGADGLGRLLLMLSLDVQFHWRGDERPPATPLNLGGLPLIDLDVSSVGGLTNHSVERLVEGAAPANFSFPEQELTLNTTAAVFATLGGGFTLTFAGNTTGLLPPHATATQVREALMALETVGELEVFRTVHAVRAPQTHGPHTTLPPTPRPQMAPPPSAGRLSAW